MTKVLLIDEPPLHVLPALAKSIGLTEAIILQELHYMIKQGINMKLKKNLHWTESIAEQLRKRFFFWSTAHIANVVTRLESNGVLVLAPEGPSTVKHITINDEVLLKMDRSLIKFEPETANANMPPRFTAKAYKKGDNLYDIKAVNHTHLLSKKLTIELKDGQALCYFPRITSRHMHNRLKGALLIYRAIIVMFQVDLLGELLLFCNMHSVANLVIDQTSDLGIIRNFIEHIGAPLTPEDGNLIIPVNDITLVEWIAFAAEVKLNLKQELSIAEQTNPNVKELRGVWLDF